MDFRKSSLKCLSLNRLCVSNKMRPSRLRLSRLYSDLVVGSVKGGGANWFGSFDLQMNTVIRINHINITPSRQDRAVYPHPTSIPQNKSQILDAFKTHGEIFIFPKVSFSSFMTEFRRTPLTIGGCKSEIKNSKAHCITTEDNNVRSGFSLEISREWLEVCERAGVCSPGG